MSMLIPRQPPENNHAQPVLVNEINRAFIGRRVGHLKIEWLFYYDD